METKFDPLVESRLQANKYPSRSGAKLTLEQRCNAYAALYQGVAQVLVATAFGLSRPSISALANCRKDTRGPITMELPDTNSEGHQIIRDYVVGNPNITPLRRTNVWRKPRYQEVAGEFNRLGETAFIQTYYTPHLKARIDEAARKRPVYGVPDLDANQYAFDRFGPFTDKWGEWFRIDWTSAGWSFRVCRDNGELRDGYSPQSDNKGKPFLTSTAAFNFLRHPS